MSNTDKPPTVLQYASILPLLRYWLSCWRFIALVTMICGGLSFFSSLLIRPVFSSKLTFLPVRPTDAPTGGSASLFGQLPFGNSSAAASEQMILTILKSRTLSEKVAQKLDLMPFIFPSAWDKQAKDWKKKTWLGKRLEPPTTADAASYLLSNVIRLFRDTKDNIFQIEARWDNPIVTQKLAITYYTELKNYYLDNEIHAAKRQRKFIEARMSEEERTIKHLEEILLVFSEGEQTLAVSLNSLEIMTKASKSLAEIAMLSVEIAALKKILPSSQALLQQREQTLVELQSLQKNVLSAFLLDAQAPNGSTIIVPVSKVPLLAIEFQRLKQQLAFHNSALLALQKEVEAAKLKEHKEEITFHLLDPPLKGEQMGPKSKIAWLTGCFLGITLALGFLGTIFLAPLQSYRWFAQERYSRKNPFTIFA